MAESSAKRLSKDLATVTAVSLVSCTDVRSAEAVGGASQAHERIGDFKLDMAGAALLAVCGRPVRTRVACSPTGQLYEGAGHRLVRPGSRQESGGVGSTNETQGNTKNTSPEPQDLECTQSPTKSNGQPIKCN